MYRLPLDLATRSSAVDGAGSAGVFWTMAAVVCFILLVGSSTRFVARHERAVVSRAGRVARVSGPGMALRLPVLEHLAVVSVDPVDLPLTLTASTRDGVRVRVMATAVCRVTRPELTTVVADPLVATARAVESQIEDAVEGMDLEELVLSTDGPELPLPAPRSRTGREWGTETLAVRIDSVEVPLTPSSLRAIHADRSCRIATATR